MSKPHEAAELASFWAPERNSAAIDGAATKGGLVGLIDPWLGKAWARQIAVDEVVLDQYESTYAEWHVKHFHQHLNSHTAGRER